MLLRPDGSAYRTPGETLLARRQAAPDDPAAPRWMNLGWWRVGAQRYPEACEALADLVAAEAGLARGMRALDVGCGFGDAAIRWAIRHGADVLGVSNVPSHVASAGWRARALGARGAAFACADAMTLPVAPESFDRVLCLESPFHFPDRDRFLRAAWHALRPGGRLVVADLMSRRARRATAWQRSVLRHCRIPEENVVPLAAYARAVGRAGFEVRRAGSIRERVFPGAARLLALVESGAATDEATVLVDEADVRACAGAERWARDTGLDDFGVIVAARPGEA